MNAKYPGQISNSVFVITTFCNVCYVMGQGCVGSTSGIDVKRVVIDILKHSLIGKDLDKHLKK